MVFRSVESSETYHDETFISARRQLPSNVKSNSREPRASAVAVGRLARKVLGQKLMNTVNEKSVGGAVASLSLTICIEVSFVGLPSRCLARPCVRRARPQ